VIEAMRDALGDGASPIFLLGVTPAIVAAFSDLVVVDWSPAARSAVADQALDGDWLDPPMAAASCGGALGDGSLTCLSWPADYTRLFAMLGRVLRPGGRVAIRCYTAVEPRERPAEVLAAAMACAIDGFAAFKWRLAMALCTGADSNVPVAAIKQSFDSLVPDRDRLAAATGWARAAIDDIDAYGGTAISYSFPTRAQLLDQIDPLFGAAHFVETAGYPLAERCPLLVTHRAQ
jgi:SAM-dependent methyltransferase